MSKRRHADGIVNEKKNTTYFSESVFGGGAGIHECLGNDREARIDNWCFLDV